MSSTTTTTTTKTQEQPPLVLRQNAEAGPNLNEYDEEQARLMEERCILVTPEDVAYGEDSKKTCKLMFPCVLGEELIYRPLDDKYQ
jgi:isopentenyl-diphosphate delta-isomerase